MNLLDLAKIAEKQKDTIKSAANKAAVRLSEDLITRLIYRTPVDTSRARSSWVIVIGTPNEREATHAIYHGRAGSTADASSREAIRRAKEILATRKGNEPIFIVNNAPYIGLLNAGRSPQASALFIEQEISATRAKLNAGEYTKDK